MKLIDVNKLVDLAAALAGAGYRVIAPQRRDDTVRLALWQPGAPIEIRAIPVNSAKEFLFPPSEVIGRYRMAGGDFTPQEVPPDALKTVLLGVRPCDVAAMAVLDAVFNWDFKDTFYNARRAATTLVAVACQAADDQCFCTSVGGAPDSVAGADAILRSADGGQKFIFEPADEKGLALQAAAAGVLTEGTAAVDPPAAVPAKFDAAAVSTWLAENFESPLWQRAALACLGCGACTYACPTCHCFDIQDEGTRSETVRLRNWDSCGLALFTAHAGGHNPRPDQASRWRQRVMHKFRYFLERFGRVACTGCGRCSRQCPAGVAMAQVCREIDEARKERAEK
jgi:ferredoxin